MRRRPLVYSVIVTAFGSANDRAEVQKAKRQIHQEAEQGSAQIKSVTDAGVTLIKDVTKQEKIEGKKQIRANAAKGRKSVEQAGSVAVQLIKRHCGDREAKDY